MGPMGPQSTTPRCVSYGQLARRPMALLASPYSGLRAYEFYAVNRRGNRLCYFATCPDFTAAFGFTKPVTLEGNEPTVLPPPKFKRLRGVVSPIIPSRSGSAGFTVDWIGSRFIYPIQ